LSTPALIIDQDLLKQNIAFLANYACGRVSLRPHAKTHKCLEISRLQIESGAAGITTATIWEASALAAAGIGDILIANQVVGSAKIVLAAQIAGVCDLTVVIDDVRNARELAAAAVAEGTSIGFLVDVDVGMGRCGVRTPEQAQILAEQASVLAGLRFRGLMGYEGHCVRQQDREQRMSKTLMAMERLIQAVQAIELAGLTVDIVSAGSTGTYDLTGDVARVTELQAGSYVFSDTAYAPIVPEFRIALTVLATVISRWDTVLVLDCGTKSIAVELALPQILGHEAIPRYVAEEHAVFDVPRDCSLDLGDRVNVISGHCCGTTNLHAVHHVVADTQIVDVWPIFARGPGRGT
jgi:D-serine deaminase-like pyridoxal phosphate-dependent protein